MKQLETFKEEVKNIPQLRLYSVGSTLSEGMPVFLGRIRTALRLIIQEPEILTFALLQWCCTIVGYFVWVQALAFFPQHGEDDLLINLAFSLWSLLIVGIVSFPLGILSGAIGASYFFRALKKESTFVKCLKAASHRYWSLWIFSWIDNWITLEQILERLPKRNDSAPLYVKLIREMIYLAWKSATLAVIPAVLLGKDLLEAVEESVAVLKSRLKEVVLLRGGYSAYCWLIGLLTYLLVIFLAGKGFIPFGKTSLGKSELYWFYLYAGFPAVAAAGVIHLFLRPIFIIASCDLYVSFVRSRHAQEERLQSAVSTN